MGAADSQLARAWTERGDRAAFHALYERHVERVYGFARHVCGSAEGAEDVVQETFLRAARAMHTCRDHGAFPGWLLAIARNAALDGARREARRGRDRAFEPPARANPGPVEAASREERREAVRAAVLHLPEAQRAAVTLCSLQELPLAQAAQALGWRVEKLKSVLHRARQRLKKDLAAYM